MRGCSTMSIWRVPCKPTFHFANALRPRRNLLKLREKNSGSIRRRRRGMPAFLYLGGGPLKEEAVGDRKQRRAEEYADEAKGKNPTKQSE